jgi:hypothetical protein
MAEAQGLTNLHPEQARPTQYFPDSFLDIGNYLLYRRPLFRMTLPKALAGYVRTARTSSARLPESPL